MKRVLWLLGALTIAGALLRLAHVALPGETRAAPQVNDLVVYTDALAEGWVHIAGWSCTYDYTNPAPTHTGDASIALTLDAWGGISVWHPDDYPADDYATLEFWVHGGAAGGQLLLVSLGDATHGLFVQVPVNNPAYIEDGTIDAGAWKQVQVPIANLMAGYTAFDRVNFETAVGYTQPTVYIDDVVIRAADDDDASAIAGARTLGLSQVELTFDEALDPASATNAANYALQSATDPAYATPVHPTAATYDPITFRVLLDLAPDLQSSTTYSVTVDGVADAYGNVAWGLEATLRTAPPAPAPLVVAVWMPTSWNYANAWASLNENLSHIHVLSPAWYEMQSDGTLTTLPGDPVMEVAALAHAAGRPVIPTIGNAFDPVRTNIVINDPALRAAHVTNIVTEVLSRSYDGIDIDYESLYASDRDAFTTFIRELAAALHAQDKLLTIALHAKTAEPGNWQGSQSQDWAALGAVVDEFRVMTYDFCWSTGCEGSWNDGSPPGPINPHWWVDRVISFATTKVDPAKVMLGIPFYGYDWPVSGTQRRAQRGRAGFANRYVGQEAWTTSAGTPRYWQDVHALIQTYEPTIEWWEADANGPIRQHWFNYDSRGVWYSDHDSVADRFALAESLGVRGIAIWCLGSEDPANWAALAQGCRLDVDGDGGFRVNDVQAVAAAWGGVAGDPVYRARADLDADGDVDGADVQQATAGWRVGCQGE